MEVKFDAPYTAQNDYRLRSYNAVYGDQIWCAVYGVKRLPFTIVYDHIRSYTSVVYIRGAESTRVRVRPIGKIFENLFASAEIFWKIFFSPNGTFSQKFCRSGKSFILAADSAPLVRLLQFHEKWKRKSNCIWFFYLINIYSNDNENGTKHNSTTYNFWRNG